MLIPRLQLVTVIVSSLLVLTSAAGTTGGRFLRGRNSLLHLLDLNSGDMD